MLPLTACCPRSTVCGGLTPFGSASWSVSASRGVPGSVLCHESVELAICADVIAGGAVSQATTIGGSFTVDRRPARFVAETCAGYVPAARPAGGVQVIVCGPRATRNVVTCPATERATEA